VALHLIKLSVGTESIEDLAFWQQERLRDKGAVYHQTRMTPRREAELLDGGSIYWIIKGYTRARQRLTGIEPHTDLEGNSFVRLMLDPELIPVEIRRHRPFQGWRYLDPKDAPPDLSGAAGDSAPLPEHIEQALRDIGFG
jgi:hypothetical protein